jgi:hypothetical protein
VGVLEVGWEEKPTSTVRMTYGNTINIGAADADIVQLAVGEIAQFLEILAETPPLADESNDMR